MHAQEEDENLFPIAIFAVRRGRPSSYAAQHATTQIHTLFISIWRHLVAF